MITLAFVLAFVAALMRIGLWARRYAFAYARDYVQSAGRAVYLSELEHEMIRRMHFPMWPGAIEGIVEELCQQGYARKFTTDTLFGPVGQPIVYLESTNSPRGYQPSAGTPP